MKQNNLFPFNDFENLEMSIPADDIKNVDDALAKYQNALSLTSNLYKLFCEENKLDLKLNTVYEVIDVENPSVYVFAKAVAFFGRWVLMQYCSNSKFTWLHPKSTYIRPLGWCSLMGIKMNSYRNKCLDLDDVPVDHSTNADCFLVDDFVFSDSSSIGNVGKSFVFFFVFIF